MKTVAQIKTMVESINLEGLTDNIDKYESISSFIDKAMVSGQISYDSYEKLDKFYRKKYGIDEAMSDYDNIYEGDVTGYINEVQIPILKEMLCKFVDNKITSSGGKVTITMEELYNCKTCHEVEQKLFDIKRDIADVA